MQSQKPIYTERTSCQDCYKCVRSCPLKAIQVENESATLMYDRCVMCGTCVRTCPVGAKKVRSERGLVQVHMRQGERVWASLAPSWAAEFPGLDSGRMAAALRRLGFEGVSETALGAQEVSEATAGILRNSRPGLWISTACPSIVELVRRHHPALVPSLLPLRSPMGAHAGALRRQYGEDIGVVFIGPCISKKLESDAEPELVNAALTFEGLRYWMESAGIDPYALVPGELDHFEPRRAQDGALFPLGDGMGKCVSARLQGAAVDVMSFSGLPACIDALQGMEDADFARPLFLELLACAGGCVNGPRMTRKDGGAARALDILKSASPQVGPASAPPEELRAAYTTAQVEERLHPEKDLQTALRQVGKFSPEDELNCGGCGYDSCRALAAALLEGRAEPTMCASYMRRLAMKKASALLRSMPSGAVIVNEQLSIVECNRRFAEMLDGEALVVYDTCPGMGGASLAKVAPALHGIFRMALEVENHQLTRDLRLGESILRVTLFPIDQGSLLGAILQDITEPAFQREQIIQKAQDVIRKNVATVQQIAFLLGENAAESEMILHSIVESFRAVTPKPKRD